MPPITWAITIWLDQFLIGILMGLLLSAAIDAPDTEIRAANIAQRMNLKNLKFRNIILSSSGFHIRKKVDCQIGKALSY
jgi:hypothetical protein